MFLFFPSMIFVSNIAFTDTTSTDGIGLSTITSKHNVDHTGCTEWNGMFYYVCTVFFAAFF